MSSRNSARGLGKLISQRGLNPFAQTCRGLMIRSNCTNCSDKCLMFLKCMIAARAFSQMPFDILVGNGIQFAIYMRRPGL